MSILTSLASRAVIVTLGRKVVVSSGVFTFCQDEAELATILARGLAAAVAEYTLEFHSRAILLDIGRLASSTLLLASVFVRKLWYISIPYSVFYCAGIASGIKLDSFTVPEELDCIMLRLLHQAGHDISRSPALFTKIAKAEELAYAELHTVKRFMNMLVF